MKIIAGFFKLVGWIVKTVVRVILAAIILVVAGLGAFVYNKGNQPMEVPRASPPLPEGITYWEFMADRIDAAQEIEPKRCGIGMMATFFVISPIYSVVYTIGGMRPESMIGRGIQSDASIPRWAAGLPWEDALDVWWRTVEDLSWSILASKGPACNFRPVEIQ